MRKLLVPMFNWNAFGTNMTRWMEKSKLLFFNGHLETIEQVIRGSPWSGSPIVRWLNSTASKCLITILVVVLFEYKNSSRTKKFSYHWRRPQHPMWRPSKQLCSDLMHDPAMMGAKHPQLLGLLYPAMQLELQQSNARFIQQSVPLGNAKTMQQLAWCWKLKQIIRFLQCSLIKVIMLCMPRMMSPQLMRGFSIPFNHGMALRSDAGDWLASLQWLERYHIKISLIYVLWHLFLNSRRWLRTREPLSSA